MVERRWRYISWEGLSNSEGLRWQIKTPDLCKDTHSVSGDKQNETVSSTYNEW
jgi:hypothetical protein